LHFITKDPSQFYNRIEKSKLHRVSFQIEEINGDFNFPKFENTKVGLAIQIGNQHLAETISKYSADIDFVLLMMTTPGISGGKFQANYFAQIRELTTLFPQLHWCIDGGVNHEISYILRLIGIQSAVVGSYLMNHQNMAEAILNIRSHKVKSDYAVSDFMIEFKHLPIVNLSHSVTEMLTEMDRAKLGIVFCIDVNNKLIGVITNADIRKILLSGKFNYDLSIENFINHSPQLIFAQNSTAKMIELIETISFPILILPVIDENQILKGAISFHKLLKED
jgi:CBS domain-containing protein